MFSSNSKFLDNILNNSINTHDNKTAFIVALNIANAVVCKNALVIREYPIISTMLPTKEIIKNGMLFQIDIIPSVSGYGGISCESGVLLADEQLIQEIKQSYPMLYKRILKRQDYMRKELGIKISDQIIPTSMATAYCRPFMLNKDDALKNI